MSSDYASNQRELLLELLAERAAGTLSAADAADLDRLLKQFPETEQDEFDRLVAAADLAFGPTSFEPLPAELRQRLMVVARQHSSGKLRLASRREPWTPALTIAWLAAAASLLLAVWAWWPKIVPRPPATAAEQLAALINTHPLEARLADPTSGQGRGSVYWSSPQQQGYMRLTGLPANDARREQYQLWIFDEQQDDRFPIDGGVFDVDRATGEVLVPIDAKLRVGKAKMFAITVEKPGGVVVSDRKRIVALGKTDG
jgi:anti-sigma-K factor RskA